MNKTFKKFLAILTTLTMAMSLFVVAPAMAETHEKPDGYKPSEPAYGGSIIPALTPAEQLWIDTNLLRNGNVEEGEITADDAAIDATENLTGNWAINQNRNDIDIVAQTSTNQAYSGNQSVLVKKNGGSEWGIFFPYVYESALKPSTAYIANYKILGTQKNEAYTGTNTVGSFLMGPSYKWSGFTANTYAVSELTAAPASDAASQGEPVGKENWKDMTLTFTSAETLPAFYGFGIKFLDADVEFYTDDYYLGELMIAEVQNTTAASTVAIPETGNATLTLSAKAVNQLGTEAGLEDTTYTYKLLYPVDGVSVNNNVLTVSSEATEQTIQVKVTANPVFAGANAQSAELKERRTSIINIELTKEAVEAPTTDIYEALRNQTNLYYRNAGLEEGVVGNQTPVVESSSWTNRGTSSNIKGAVVNTHAYNGNNSYLTEFIGTARAERSFAPFVYTGKLRANATYVASVMAIGTQQNLSETAVESDIYNADAFYLQRSNSGGTLTNIDGYTQVYRKDFAQAPASTATTQENVDKSAWVMFDRAVQISDTLPAYLGYGLAAQGYGVEAYTDDYYLGELVVANVDVTADKTSVLVSDEAQTITLTAEAYNQLGNTKYLQLNETEPYTYTLESAPNGVTVSDAGVITVPAGTAAGKVVVKVTANPTFLGQDTQTEAQKALREKVVTIDIKAAKAAKGFNFNVTTPGYVTPQAYVDALDSNAKAYCALYKVLDGGAKKLMAVNSAPLEAGETEVDLTEIEIPTTYDYEIKCFMWYEGTMQNVIPAVIWE